MKKLLSVIIPVYNEEKTIKKILQKVNQIKLDLEVIVINDGSNDSTYEILQNNRDLFEKIISYKENKGKGYACRQGIKEATGIYLVIQDADLEYNPYNLYDLYNKISENIETDVVYGSRVLKGGVNVKPPGLRHYFSKFANFLLTLISNFLNGQRLTDAHTCYKMFKTKVIKSLNLKENGFAFCPEVTAKISKQGVKIHECPIDYFGRNYNEGKKIKLKDAFGALFALVKYNYPYKNYKNWLRG